MHDVLVVDPLSHFLQQPVMPDIVKVGSQIKVEDPRLPLSYCFRHSLDRVVCCPLGPISIRPRLEVSLEHRFEDELERTLHHSVPDRRDRQDADFAPVFRYLLLPGWEWLVVHPVSSSRSCSSRVSTPCASMASNVTPSIPGAPSFCLAIAYAARRVSILQTWTYSPQKRQDGSAFALTYSLRLRSCNSMDAFVISSLPSLRWRHCKWQGPFAPRTLLRFLATPDPAATLSSLADFPVSPVIRPTLLRRFRAGTRRASPVAQHVLVTVPSLPPRRGEKPYRSVFGCSYCLRPSEVGSALGATFFEATMRSLLIMPGDSCSPSGDLVDRLRRFCFHLLRYPNYGALTFTPAGLSPAEHASLTWTHLRTKNRLPNQK